jgi:TRAP transporter TAXI family solute receptor
MKKTLCIILALCLVLALGACSKAPAAQASPGNAAPAGQQSAAVSDTSTVAVGAVILARDDVSEDQIYAFVSNIFDNVAAITEQHAKGGELDLKFAAGVTSVPYHPGAAKYFAEKGVTVAAVKEGAGTGAKGNLTFGTGGDTGTYYGFGSVLANFVSGKTDFTVTAVVSGGSKANIEDLMSGDVQLGFAQSDVMSYAYNGERLFDTALKDFSVVAALYMEQVQIVTTNSAIGSVADLKGKTVSIGAVGSGVYFNAIDVLNAYGLSENDIKPVYQSFGDSADSLKDGKIDAAFIVAGAPTTAITDLAATGSVYLVSLDDAHVKSLLDASPFYSAYVIPAGTY